MSRLAPPARKPFVPFGSGEAPAKMMVGVLSLEFLVHAWDYAKACGREVAAPDSLSDYVLGVAKTVITPEGRSNVGFDDPIDVTADAGALDRLIAYTGRFLPPAESFSLSVSSRMKSTTALTVTRPMSLPSLSTTGAETRS